MLPQRRTVTRKKTALIQVRFSHDFEHNITGEIIGDNVIVSISHEIMEKEDLYSDIDFNDWNKGKNQIHRNKRAVIYGYMPSKYNTWDALLPQDGEIWFCMEVGDTKSDSPYRGSVLVRLIEKIG
ncbi:MAG: hypothetical protein ABIH48_02450 [Candidatus Falkowbacteria bacterium]